MKPKTNTELFKIRMIELNTTQTELSDELGVSKQTINAWVKGRTTPPLGKALQIADRLGCSIHDLWKLNNEEEKE